MGIGLLNIALKLTMKRFVMAVRETREFRSVSLYSTLSLYSDEIMS